MFQDPPDGELVGHESDEAVEGLMVAFKHKVLRGGREVGRPSLWSSP